MKKAIKMTASDHNKQVMEQYFKDISSRSMVSIEEASKLNYEYLITHDKSIRDRILLGTQHLIFSTLNTLNLDLKDQTIIDYEDVISYFNLYFAEGIENGLFCDVEALKEIVTNKVIVDLISYIHGSVFKKYEEPLQTQKETAIYDPEITYSTDPTNRIKKYEVIGDLLKELYDNGHLITKEMYQRYTRGESDYDPNKLRKEDIFDTDEYYKKVTKSKDGILLKIINSHPLYSDIRERVSKIM